MKSRSPEKMWRINQTAHTFKDKRKDASKKACRKGNWKI